MTWRPVGVISIAATVAVFAVLASSLAGLWYLPDFDSPRDFIVHARTEGVRVLDVDGMFLGAEGKYYGKIAELESLPRHFLPLLIFVEDGRFDKHGGVDLIAFVRAAWICLTTDRTEGGSTLTMQVLKIAGLHRMPKYLRKMAELGLAPFLSYRLQRSGIASVYINTAPMGGYHGIDAASWAYFAKSPARLTLLESAILIQALAASSANDPHRHPKRALRRARARLDAAAKAGVLNSVAVAKAKRQKLYLRPDRRVRSVFLPRSVDVGWFLKSATAQLRQQLPDVENVPTVRTTMNPVLQRIVEVRARKALARGRGEYDFVSVIAMDMAANVVGMFCGQGFRKLEFDTCTQAERQAGSVGKIFAALMAAGQGIIGSDLVNNEPIRIGRHEIVNGCGGHLLLSEAMAQSRNCAFVRLVLGHEQVLLNLHRALGITTALQPSYQLALGAYETRLDELTAAYRSAVSDGCNIAPNYLKDVRDGFGRSVPIPKLRSTQVLSPRQIAVIRDLLAGVVEHGTGRRAAAPRVRGGKTGTTDGNRDAAFVGHTDQLVIAVQFGRLGGSPMRNVTGGNQPSELFAQIARDAAPLRFPARGSCIRANLRVAER